MFQINTSEIPSFISQKHSVVPSAVALRWPGWKISVKGRQICHVCKDDAYFGGKFLWLFCFAISDQPVEEWLPHCRFPSQQKKTLLKRNCILSNVGIPSCTGRQCPRNSLKDIRRSTTSSLICNETISRASQV